MKLSYEKIAYFYDRTTSHIKSVILIQEYLNKFYGNRFNIEYWHDQTKFSVDAIEGYFYLTFKYLNEKLTKDENDDAGCSWVYHYCNETHHPEFFTFSGVIDDMSEQDMFWMVSDWLAMSYEFSEDDFANFWQTKMIHKFNWTTKQKDFIGNILTTAIQHKDEMIELLDKNIKFPKWK